MAKTPLVSVGSCPKVVVKFIETTKNTADLFTKVLARAPFEEHRRTVMNLRASAESA